MEALLLHQVEHLQQALPCHAQTTKCGLHWSGHTTVQCGEGQHTRIAHMRQRRGGALGLHHLFPSVRRCIDRLLLRLLRLLPDTMAGDGLELLAKQAHALVPPRVGQGAVVVVSPVPCPLGGGGGRME